MEVTMDIVNNMPSFEKYLNKVIEVSNINSQERGKRGTSISY